MVKVKDFFTFKRMLPGLNVLAGSFFIATGWSWYHFNKHEKMEFVLKANLILLIFLLSFYFFKKLYIYAVNKYKKHEFWRTTFEKNLEELYFLASLFFLVFLIDVEIFSLFYSAAILVLFYLKTNKVLTLHPDPIWGKLNTGLFSIAFAFFALQAVVQYLAFKYYILDDNIIYYNIVLFRAIGNSIFWVFSFILASFLLFKVKNISRYLLFIFWIFLFSSVFIFWIGNIGVLYYSGLYFGPTALQHLGGAGDVFKNKISVLLSAGAIFFAVIYIYLLNRSVKIFKEGIGHLYYYVVLITLLFTFSFFGLSSFRNTPEVVVANSFYNYYFGDFEAPSLNPVVQHKLEKFGLFYKTDDFYLVSKGRIFTTTTQFLPERFIEKKPNIVIFFLESFSSRLTDVYYSKFENVTPELKEFSENPNSTIFKNFYNASTPTITGSLSLLCSFLPTTGHEEIQNEGKMQNHHLLCLPEVLKKEAGFKYSTYITAVDKNYANKDGIFSSMGIDEVYGLRELKKVIKGEPLSWGYSDHQMIPVVWDMMQKSPQPFLITMATVDTHPPFNLAKDAVNYKDATRPVLNMIHTTDHAFGEFWEKFKQSEFYNNTIVVAVADHAIFPGALTTDLFKEEAKTLNFYDQNFFVLYVPESNLPKEVDVYSSGIDFTPTLLHLLDINIPNSFEGYSIFDGREKYPSLLGMHEFGLYINEDKNGERKMSYDIPLEINCPDDYNPASFDEFTLCDFKQFYNWKRKMFEEGRFWKR